MNIITNTKDLEILCKNLSKDDFVTIDLEFLREKSYYAKLCLIQIASTSEAAIIDPLAPDIKLSPFFKLLKNKNILKVFHSGRQDIEILYNLTGFIPDPVFDTQIAAMVCGFGESVSYENLVSKVSHQSLDKSHRLSDWSKRPLTEAQLSYALSDVTHLVNIYCFLREVLKDTNRESWLDEENEILKNPQTYVIDPNEAWHKIKHRSHSPHFLTILRELAAWREKRAQEKDTPRQSIIKDDILLNIAAMNPKTQQELTQIRNIRKDILNGKLASEILTTLEKARKIPSSQYVQLEKENRSKPGAPALSELLKLLLRIKSQEHGVVARLIANDDDIKNLSSFSDDKNPVLKGWRYEIFGKDALSLRDGTLSISYNKSKHSIDLKSV